MSEVKIKLIKIAYENPKLREELLPVIIKLSKEAKLNKESGPFKMPSLPALSEAVAKPLRGTVGLLDSILNSLDTNTSSAIIDEQLSAIKPEDIKTFGDIKTVIKLIRDRRTKSGLLKILYSTIGPVKETMDLVKIMARADDAKKTKTWLDKLNIDDEYSKIVDDRIENNFINQMSEWVDRQPDTQKLPDDFSVNGRLTSYLQKNFEQRKVDGAPPQNS